VATFACPIPIPLPNNFCPAPDLIDKPRSKLFSDICSHVNDVNDVSTMSKTSKITSDQYITKGPYRSTPCPIYFFETLSLSTIKYDKRDKSNMTTRFFPRAIIAWDTLVRRVQEKNDMCVFGFVGLRLSVRTQRSLTYSYKVSLLLLFFFARNPCLGLDETMKPSSTIENFEWWIKL
jgi:hypothetical protein